MSHLSAQSGEYPFPSGRTLVSTTDTQGYITYANKSFIEVSGYTRGELLGSPQNLIRHPDMPKEAFRDMWATISSGKPWAGLVKNKRKDGLYYWVAACITPLMQGSTITGYMSVRTQPLREDIERIAPLYRQMRAQEDMGRTSHKFSNGFVVEVGFAGLGKRASRKLKPGAPALTAMMAALSAYLATKIGSAHPLAEVGTMAACALGSYLVVKLFEQKAWHKPLVEVADRAKSICAGQVKPQVMLPNGSNRVTEIARPINMLNVLLLSLVQDSRAECNDMLVDTGILRKMSEQMASRASTQAASLDSTAAAMEELSATVAQTAAAAQHAAKLTQEVQGNAAQGAASVVEIGSCLANLNQAGAKIRGITDLIEGIAFQTNILALNAAIEAARAGEHGRGFSVVAAEVRTLARRTNDASKDIQKLIDAMASTARASNIQTEKARGQIEGAMQQINQVTTLISEIGHASSEQNKGLAQVNTAITNVDQLVHGSAELSKELHIYANNIHNEGERVLRSIQTFHAPS